QSYQSASLGYDDGFGAWVEPQAAEEADEAADAEHDIGGAIPDDQPAAAEQQSFTQTFTASEYPQASRFVPAASVNYRATNGRTIDKVVIHITDGGSRISGTIGWFQNPNQRNRRDEPIHVSAHYVVGQDGEVVQMVMHKDVAWHAGSANSHSIGIEHVANTRGLLPTAAQYCASAALVRWLCDTFSIPIDRQHIQGHAEADTRTSHTDCPNAVWDWDYFMGMVRSATCYERTATGQSMSLGTAAAFSTDIPLDPGTGGRSIGLDALEPGDIILSTTNAGISRAIRAMTGSAVSHAMIYTGDGGQVVEAVGDGVIFRPLAQAIADATVAVAFRHPNITSDQALLVRDFVGQQIGKSYNYWGIVRQARFQIDRAYCRLLSGDARAECENFVGRVWLGTADNETFFCSQLVLAAYEAAGLPLTSNPPNWGSPDDLAQLRLSNRLNYVGHLKAPPVPSGQSLAADYRGNGNGYHRGNGRQAGAARTAPRAMDAIDFNWGDVQLVPQLTGGSCWAAAAAMVVGWRDRVSIDPAEVARGTGRWAEYTGGLLPDDRRALANALGLVAEPPVGYTVSAFQRMLENNGPLWVGVAIPYGHAVTVTGIYGDGTPDGTFVRINDPEPVGEGSQTTKTFSQFMREYEKRMTTDDSGNVNVQVLHANGRRPVTSAQALENQSFDFNWGDVQLVPQPNGMSCWAAAAAMVVGWRDRVSIDPAEVARGAGRWAEYTGGLNPDNIEDLARAWGLVIEPPRSYSIEGFRQLIQNNGPIWLGVASPSGHAVTVTGIYGDGTPDGTFVRINDPGPPGEGTLDTITFSSLAQQYEGLLTVHQRGHINAQVLHANGRRPVSGAQAYAASAYGSSAPAARQMQAQVVPVAAAITGAVMTRILNNEGDITWELDQLQGLKHPGNNPANQGTATFSTRTVSVPGLRVSTVLGIDQIYADAEITFQYNGRSLGNVQIAITQSNDAYSQGLVVRANIMDEANVFTRPPSTEQFAAIKVRFHYRFTSPIQDDKIGIIDFVLFGDGTFNRQSRWT
ncbi:MAG TPA: papain-like cysteine protease family protein, partial [Pyrinomonadaceae bacterium]|nr:papain-like cysteine protease family protein [Pyrinomonadaceae bacterium]